MGRWRTPQYSLFRAEKTAWLPNTRPAWQTGLYKYTLRGEEERIRGGEILKAQNGEAEGPLHAEPFMRRVDILSSFRTAVISFLWCHKDSVPRSVFVVNAQSQLLSLGLLNTRHFTWGEKVNAPFDVFASGLMLWHKIGYLTVWFWAEVTSTDLKGCDFA